MNPIERDRQAALARQLTRLTKRQLVLAVRRLGYLTAEKWSRDELIGAIISYRSKP